MLRRSSCFPKLATTGSRASGSKRGRLRGRYRALIKETARAGLVLDDPIEMLTDVVFGSVEATMTWTEAARRSSAARAPHVVASAAVRGVLRAPPSAEELRIEADRLSRH